MKTRVAAAGIVSLVLVGVAGLWFAFNWVPTIPAAAASIPIAEAALSDGGSSNSQQCLDRIVRSAGWADLCWDIHRAADGDPDKDYYTLRVYGTVSGAGGGIRWTRVRADLIGAPAGGAFDGWPDGTIDGSCRSMEVNLPANLTTQWQEVVCGRTIGAKVTGAWGHTVEWSCVGCLIPDRSTRAVVLYEAVGVPQGATPKWWIGADFGD